MADLTRSKKLVRLWGPNELRAFNIEVIDVDTETFFGTADLPPPTLSDVILNNSTLPEKGYSRDDEYFFQNLQHSFIVYPSNPNTVIDFAAILFQLLNYDMGCGRPGSALRFLKSKFTMCGKNVVANVDLGLVHLSDDNVFDYMLILQKKLHDPECDTEAHLIANAIAAFYTLNQGLRSAGLPEVPSKQYPGIVADKTAPTFYKITVTKQLLDSVAAGQYPVQATIVERLQVASLVSEPEQGMKPLADRYIILQCFEALKHLIK